ncbi:hypothetical protein Poli38472_001676 [Pythium oligandrum]|uniref:Enoyl reductase (ER) domain-containing protein n=1 Tax=Pythium oligandrum TaxID=41045 RepID=A0A8K1CTW9_PYTOL|nr:hypothetical protein Poli38472_001676 [Pythium oligandrum]|eukprot:TMW69520.1 hypothetical protein Poli38472_001676 [Pythium oligandrum]
MVLETRTVKALAAFKPGLTVEAWEYQAPALGPQDIEIAISHCGVCAADTHNLQNNWGMSQYPMVPGHEIVGSVTAVGSQVTDLQLGDRVGVGCATGTCLECSQCTQGKESYCAKAVYTYNGRRPDGSVTYGGYADSITVDSRFAFKIPEEIPSAAAAPLLCAGITVFTPLREHVKPGQRVGVVGIGGLGHLAIQFARALGAEPVAFSRSTAKEAEARKFGAVDFVDVTNPEAVAKAQRSVDVLIVTADAKKQPYNTYLSFVKFRGVFLLVACPVDDVSFNAFAMLMSNVTIVGSVTGGNQDMNDMFALAAAKNVRPMIQTLPMHEANKGLAMVDQGHARYRVVLEN